ncbi:MAG: toprim domain-containing protein, partial [Microbacteriaceae bacterium]|nr:toprim domain-containing protein [Burkholderiaceae bacterium]
VQYYHGALKQSPEALAYLQSRGLAHPELIEHFKLGFANRTLGLRLADKRRVEGAQMRARLERLGVYRASGHEHFTGRLVVPVLDAPGQVRELYGRKIGERLRAGTPMHMYLPGNPSRGRGVFNVQALKAAREVIQCESIIDALTFWCAGYRNVTTAYGVEGFTEEMLQAFKDHGTQRVLIAFDRDEAGERAAAKLAPLLQAAGIEVWRIEFPKGMDANEYALKVTPAAKSLGILIRKAAWLGKGQPPQRTPAPAQETEQPNSRHQEDDRSPLLAAAPVAAPVFPTAEPGPLPTVRVPDAAPAECAAEVDVREVTMTFGEGAQARRWRVRGLAKNLAYEVLKVNVLVAAGEAFHVDTFDLYAARARASFIAQAGGELRVAEDMLKADLGRVLLKLEALQDSAIQDALKPKAPALPVMTADEHMAALHLLNDKDLPARILADFEAVGVVGEATNCLVGYLAAVSRKLERPLAVVIQSSSAAGKSSLMDAVLSFVPEEERVQYSAMTGQSLFYMGQTNLKNKILAIAEEEGAHRASYALKLLQSEGELTIASTGTDPATGNLVTQEYRVEGPMSLFMTTTAIDIDEELMNRCLVLSVDEDREQTRAIHRLQRERRTLAGLTKKHERQAILTLHRNAQRLLRPLAVVNPWADQLTFLDDRTRTRRDHDKYLTLIDAIALLHQHQRPIRSATIAGQVVEYIEATVADIELANRIAHQVLGASLDELPPQTRRVLVGVRELVQARMAEQGLPQREVRFARGELRAATGVSDTQLKVHLARLAELEYLLVHRALRGQGFVYELLYDGDALASVHLSGLIDTAALQKHSYDAQRPASNEQRPGSGRGAAGGQPDPGRTIETLASPHAAKPASELPVNDLAARATPTRKTRASYLQPLAA